MLDFLKNSSILIIGAKGSTRAALRKMMVDLGCNVRKIENISGLDEFTAIADEKSANFIIIDEDTSDLDKINILGSYFKEKTADKLLVLLCHESREELIKQFNMQGGELIIHKPYTIASFQDKLLDFLKFKQKEEEKKIKEEEKILKLTTKAKQAYQPLIEAFENIPQQDDEFHHACLSFFDSLDSKIDMNLLFNVLDKGMELKRYKELNAFVEIWIEIMPVKTEHVTDISRVVVYNKNFTLFEKLNPKDKQSRIVVGAGLVIAAYANMSSHSHRQQVLNNINKGLELSEYKNTITQKAIEILVKIGEVELARSIFMKPMVKTNLQESEKISLDIENLLVNP